MNDDLDSLSDTQLNDVLSALLPPPEHQWIESRYGPDECAHCGAAKWDDEHGCRIHWAWSVTEVLKLLDRLSPDWSSRTIRGQGTTVRLPFTGPHPWTSVEGSGPTLARAGAVAAIRALRAEADRLAALAEAGPICGRCKEPVRSNVPRLGWAAGAVHVNTSRIECGDEPAIPTAYTTP